MKRRYAMVLLVAALVQAGGAQTTPGQAQGRGAAGPGKVDLSSPRAALMSLYTAMRNGDIAAAKACMSFEDPRHAENFELSMTQVWGPMRLMRALEAKFGEEAGRKPFANAALQKSVDDSLEKVKHAKFELEEGGKSATVSQKKAAINPSAENELTGITLRKEGESWKVEARTFSDASSDLPPAQLQMMRKMRDAIVAACDGTLARLARGDFKTAEAAYADYQARVKAASENPQGR